MDKVFYAGQEYAVTRNCYVEGMDWNSVGKLCSFKVKELSNGAAFIEKNEWYHADHADITPTGVTQLETVFASHSEALARSAELIRTAYPESIVLKNGMPSL